MTSPCSCEDSVDESGAAPNPLNNTFASDRFIALHMILVKIKPLAPTNAPATISTLLRITNPAAHAANPEKLFKRAITTGISAPPIGITNKTPKMKASPISNSNVCSEDINP